MRKKQGNPLTLISLIVAVAGLVVAVIALLDKRCCAICEDLDDEDLVEYLDDENKSGEEDKAPETADSDASSEE